MNGRRLSRFDGRFTTGHGLLATVVTVPYA